MIGGRLIVLRCCWVCFGGLVGCGSERDAGAEEGAEVADFRGAWVGDGVYENRVFGFSLRIPKGWVVERGAGVMRGEAFRPIFLARLEAGGGSVFEMTVEDLDGFPGVSDGETYLKTVKPELAGMFGERFWFVGDLEVVVIDGVELGMQNAAFDSGDGVIGLRTYAMHAEGKVMLFFLRSTSKEDGELLDGVVRGMRGL